jgi:NitT/TauT family transport system substrate-binding protein
MAKNCRQLRTRRLLVLLTVVFAMVAAACSDGADTTTTGGEGGGDEKFVLTMRHSWLPDDLYLPYAMARSQGYYADEGITLVDQNGNGGATAAVLVGNGDVMVGTGEASHVINARSQGIPVVSVMQQIQEQPAGVIAFKDSGINSWTDLVGKSVGGTAASSSSLAFEVSLRLQGVDPADVEFVNLSAGANFAAFQEGEIDAAITFLGNIASLPYKDDLVILPFGEAGFASPSTTVFVSEEFLDKNPEVVEGFVRASLKGLRDTIADPQAAAEAMASQYALINVDDIVGRWLLNEQFVVTSFTEENGLGAHNEESWQFLVDTLVENDQLDEAVDIKTAFTNTIVERIPTDQR